jgi:hypothetical protein
MLLTLSDIRGHSIAATDGTIGTVIPILECQSHLSINRRQMIGGRLVT